MRYTKEILGAMYKAGNVRMSVALIAGISGLDGKIVAKELQQLHRMGQVNGRNINGVEIPPATKLKSMPLFEGLDVVRRPSRSRQLRSSAE